MSEAGKRATSRRKTVETAAEPAPQASTRRVIELRGSLDQITPDGIADGWCWSPDAPDTSRAVAIIVDGVEAVRTVANLPRDDLRGAGMGDGAHGFRVTVPTEHRRPGETSAVGLHDLATGRDVGGTREVVWANAEATVAAPSSVPLAGNIDTFTRDGWLSGWCWDPAAPNRRIALEIFVDEQRAGSVTADISRPDLQRAGVGDGQYGFSFAVPYDVLAERGLVRVRVAERDTGRPLGEPALLQIGRRSQAELRVAELERQVTLMQRRMDDMARATMTQPEIESRAARALFATVAAFFRDLADGVATEDWAAGLRGGIGPTLAELRERLPPLALRPTKTPIATVAVPATAPVERVHACLAALQRAGTDLQADIVLLQPDATDPRAALLPGLVPHLRVARHEGGVVAALSHLLRSVETRIVAVISPEVEAHELWLAALVVTIAEEGAAIAGGVALRSDGLLQHAGFALHADQRLRDLGHLARGDLPRHRFMRPVDAVGALVMAMDRDAVATAGGLDPAFTRLPEAIAALSLRLRGAGRSVMVQPTAQVIWTGARHDDPHLTVPDPLAPDEDSQRLRLAVMACADARSAAGFVGHALVVDEMVPRPDHDAGSVAALAQMHVLRRLGWRVTFAAASGQPATEHDRRRLERGGIEVADPAFYPAVTDYLRAEGGTLDLVHLYRHRIASLLIPRVRDMAPLAKIVFSPADLHFLREQREAALVGRDAASAETTRQAEVRCARDADATILLSDYEQRVLADEVAPAKLHLLRWVSTLAPAGPGFEARGGVMFIGNFQHPPNVDGMVWFAAEVLPLLRRLRPGLVVHVAGPEPPPGIRDLAGADVVVHGWVPDLAPLLARVRATVAPLRYGAGFKGKVATSLSHGVPVVGTAIAFEGTGLAQGDGVLMAEDAQGLASAVVAAHDDSALWSTLSQRGRAAVERLYSPAAAAEIFRTLLRDLNLPAAAPG